MVSSPDLGSRADPGIRVARKPQPNPNEHVAPSRSKAPWPLDTFWSSSSSKRNLAKSLLRRTPDLDDPNKIHPDPFTTPITDTTGPRAVKDSSFDFPDLPLTPPDSGESAFNLATTAHASSTTFLTNAHSTFPSSPELSTALPTHTSSVQSKPSKNDIFNSPTTWVAPPTRLVAAKQADSVPLASSPSRNALFFSSSNAVTPPSSAIRADSSSVLPAGPSPPGSSMQTFQPQDPPPSTAPQQAVGRRFGHSRNSSLGRASSEEREQEEARIRNTKDVEFRLCPTNEYILGEGRHCTVYLGSYWSRKRARYQSSSALHPIQDVSSSAPAWKLCAIKRLHADRQSQLLGLDEAFALRRLGHHPNIIKLIDIRDEVELSPSPLSTPNQETRAGKAGLGLGLPKVEKTSSDHLSSGLASFGNHVRSISDTAGKDQDLSEAQSSRRALGAVSKTPKASRHASLALDRREDAAMMPTFQVQDPEGTALSHIPEVNAEMGRDNMKNLGTSAPMVRRSSPANPDPPRLLILLELLPNNLALYSKKHADRIDFEQWLFWAIQMLEAVVFLHSKGCIHADIKKENMLLTEDLGIKLCDFNSAVFPNPSDPPRDGLGLGTPAYCAPELSRATGGAGATSFSFPIDIFSLGAVLYSLATGYEPFSKARSVVEMLHRKRAFFDSEENDRASRLAVEAGSNPNSQPASRRGSLRGRKAHSSTASEGPASPTFSPNQVARSLANLLQAGGTSSKQSRRDASSDSVESVASSITTMSGRHPSALAVARLLEPTVEPRGLLLDSMSLTRKSSLVRDLHEVDLKRHSSMGRLQRPSPVVDRIVSGQVTSVPMISSSSASSHRPSGGVGRLQSTSPSLAIQIVKNLEPPMRPDSLRRRSSYGDEIKSSGSQPLSVSGGNLEMVARDAPTSPKADELSTTPTKPSRLRSAFFPPDLQRSSEENIGVDTPHRARHVQTQSESDAKPVTSRHGARGSDGSLRDIYPDSPHQHVPLPEARTEDLQAAEGDGDAHYLEPYADGNPAIILPGGTRLPDQARELLRSMLQADPARRPTAKEALQILQTFDRFCNN